jgi:hypothetical protein
LSIYITFDIVMVKVMKNIRQSIVILNLTTCILKREKFWARLKLEGERPEVQRTILVNDVKYTKRQKREIYLIFLNEQAHECQFH